MFANFKAIALSYKTAPVSVRELIALDETGCKELMLKLSDVLAVQEAIVLSTCNRTEVYYTAEQDISQEVIALLLAQKGIPLNQESINYFQVLNQHTDAVERLFRVSMGLESQVVGDIQIANQVKNAYQWSADSNMAGPFLHRLLHTIFFTNKRVVQETAFRDGAASVSYAAAEIVEELTSNIANPSVLVLGLGEIGADVARNLRNTSIQDVVLSNRTRSKAEEIASETQFSVVDFESRETAMQRSDVIICSVARETPLIDKETLSRIGNFTFKYLLDLSVPRSVDPAVEEIPGVLLYNVDTINNRANEAVERRKAAIPHVEAIIADSMTEFQEWNREMIVSPVIHKLKNTLEQIRREEIARHTRNLDDKEIEKIEKITRGMMQKIIKVPVLQLKAACKRGEAETLVDILNDLFDLERSSLPEEPQSH